MHLHQDEQQAVANYQAAFSTCYPQRNLDIKPAGREGLERKARFRIIIDGEAGDPIGIDAMLSATQDFKRGR